MKEQTLVHKPLPQNPDIWVSVPDYKEPILPITNGFGWFGIMSYSWEGDKLMCHECGKFFDELGHHIKKHNNITAKEYKEKFGLLRGTKLTSTKVSIKRHNSYFTHPETNKNIEERFKKISQLSNRGKGQKRPLEFFNRKDSCPAQMIRRFKQLLDIYGEKITRENIKNEDSNLLNLICLRYGSLNKYKQMFKLKGNEPHGRVRYEKRLILLDIVNHYRQNKRWVTSQDYKNKLMLCCYTVLKRHGGIEKLRQEAIKLKDEQDKRPQNNNTQSIANRIEMEYAGRARV